MARILPTVMGPIDVGPFGGTSGKPWDDGFMHDGVQEINISYDTHGIGTFNAVYKVNGHTYPGPRHYAGIGGRYTNATITLQQNERLVRVDVHHGPRQGTTGNIIRSLSFTTSLGNVHGPYGVKQGAQHSVDSNLAGPDGDIVGFFGTTSYNYLESIGLYISS